MRLNSNERKNGRLSPARLSEAITTLQDTGVVVVDNVFEIDQLSELRKDYELLLTKYLESKGGLEGLEGKTFGKNHVGFFPDMRGLLGNETFAANPLAVQIMNAALGADFHSSFYHTNTALPGSGIQAVHRDYAHLFGTEMNVPTPVTSLVLNVPLCDFTEHNGSTEYWPGSHLIVDKKIEDSKNLLERSTRLPTSRLNMKLGSFALRDLRVWHRGMPNNANYARTMLAIVYHRGFIAEKPILIPDSLWKTWSETAKKIFRKNTVVPDIDYRPATW